MMRRILRPEVSAGADSDEVRLEVAPSGDGALRVRIAGAAGDAAAGAPFEARPGPGGWTISRGRRTLEAGVTRDPDGALLVDIGGRAFRFPEGRRPAERAGSGVGGGSGEVRTSMPGKVVRILRAEGERVEAGEPVLVFEAMKMQNGIAAPEAGVIANMKVSEGKLVEAGDVLFRLDPV